MLVQYTSGSTGDPKGVVISSWSMMANLKMIQTTYGVEQGDTGVSWLTPYHDMGLVGCIFFPVSVGGTCVLMSPSAFMRRPLRWLEAISGSGPSFPRHPTWPTPTASAALPAGRCPRWT
jgi:acyl-CoA synthetase (AMP-forming)/AMP-acid ligase II